MSLFWWVLRKSNSPVSICKLCFRNLSTTKNNTDFKCLIYKTKMLSIYFFVLMFSFLFGCIFSSERESSTWTMTMCIILCPDETTLPHFEVYIYILYIYIYLYHLIIKDTSFSWTVFPIQREQRRVHRLTVADDLSFWTFCSTKATKQIASELREGFSKALSLSEPRNQCSSSHFFWQYLWRKIWMAAGQPTKHRSYILTTICRCSLHTVKW